MYTPLKKALHFWYSVLHLIGTNCPINSDFTAGSRSQSLQYTGIPAFYQVCLTEKSLVFGCAAVLSEMKFFHTEAAKRDNTDVL